ncbi:hypothetical protein JTB14_009657 [Gonioctena quinquepunctata]|nr:hypothetical protein JTB14_009657 [Gonioctena quinquepunctata]
MQPSVRAFCHRLSLILDILPLLSRIIVPTFRPVSLHLYTKEEKERLLNVVRVMIDYNLTYIQERLPEGNYVYNLEPNIDEVVVFDKANRFQRKTLSYPNKQLIAREIELEKLKQFEAPKTVEKSTKKKVPTANDAHLPNHLQRLQAKSVKPVIPIVRKDFFGREIKATATSTSGKTGPNLNNDIWYQYKEGYNNAVRKKIKISSLK